MPTNNTIFILKIDRFRNLVRIRTVRYSNGLNTKIIKINELSLKLGQMQQLD